VRGEVPVRGGADLARPGLRHHVPEARDGVSMVRLALPADHLAPRSAHLARHRGVKAGDAVLVQRHKQRVVPGEPAG